MRVRDSLSLSLSLSPAGRDSRPKTLGGKWRETRDRRLRASVIKARARDGTVEGGGTFPKVPRCASHVSLVVSLERVSAHHSDFETALECSQFALGPVRVNSPSSKAPGACWTTFKMRGNFAPERSLFLGEVEPLDVSVVVLDPVSRVLLPVDAHERRVPRDASLFP